MNNDVKNDALVKDIQAVADIDAVPTILNVICRTTGMGFAAVARVTKDRWIACRVRDQINFGLKEGGELEVQTTICDEIRDHLKPVIIDHVAEDEHYRSHHTPAKYGFQSYISMPIMLPDGDFFGTLCAIDPKPKQLNTPEIIGMFTLFAELIAFHLSAREQTNASEIQIIKERKASHRREQYALDQAIFSEAKLHEAEEASQLREQFIAVLGHDLRNPLGAIASGAMLLQMSPQLDARGKQITTMIRECVSRISGLIDNVLDFARGRLGGGITLEREIQPSAESVVKNTIEEIRMLHPQRQLETFLDSHEPIYCDKRRITQLLSNLLGNAMAYGAKDQAVRVQAVVKNGMFELSVSNGGTPIPAHKLQQLFQPFSRGEEQSDTHGLGLGLYIAWQIAMAHGGTLSATSTEEETCFTLRMPSKQ